MKKISAFILILVYAAFSIGGVGGFEFSEADIGVIVKEKVASVDKQQEKSGDFFKVHKIVKHASAVVKAKKSRSNAAFLEPRNEVAVYHSFLILQRSGTVHPHIEHTPLFLMNRVLLI